MNQLIVECPFCGARFDWESAAKHRRAQRWNIGTDAAAVAIEHFESDESRDAADQFRRDIGVMAPLAHIEESSTRGMTFEGVEGDDWSVRLSEAHSVVGRLCPNNHILPRDFAEAAVQGRVAVVAVAGPAAAGKSELLDLIRRSADEPPAFLRHLDIGLLMFGEPQFDDPDGGRQRAVVRHRLPATRELARDSFGVTVLPAGQSPRHLLFIDVAGEAMADIPTRAQHIVGADIIVVVLDATLLDDPERLTEAAIADLLLTTRLSSTTEPARLADEASRAYSRTCESIVQCIRTAYPDTGFNSAFGRYIPKRVLVVFSKADRILDRLPRSIEIDAAVNAATIEWQTLDTLGLYMLALGLSGRLSRACDLLLSNFLTIEACAVSATGNDASVPDDDALPVAVPAGSESEVVLAGGDGEMLSKEAVYPASARPFGLDDVWVHLIEFVGVLHGTDNDVVLGGQEHKDRLRVARRAIDRALQR